MSSLRALLANRRRWVAALVAVAAAGVVGAVVLAGGSGETDADPTTEALEEQETQPSGDDPARNPSADEPEQRERSPEKGRDQAATTTGDAGARQDARDDSAGVLSARNPLRRARRQGIEVLRATPEGADEILRALSGGGKDAPPAAYEELLEDQPK